MRIIIADLTGKVSNYCTYLCNAISKRLVEGDELLLCSSQPSVDGLCESIKLSGCQGLAKVISYLQLIWTIRRKSPDVVHLQSLLFVEHNRLDSFFLRRIRRMVKTKVFYTHHSLYPHNMTDFEKPVYRERLNKVFNCIDTIIVHTQYDRKALIEEFGVSDAKIIIITQGMFEPKGDVVKPVNKNDGYTRYLMFGIQSEYKGTDIFIDAISTIPVADRERMKFKIIGKTDALLYEQYIEKASLLGIDWYPNPVSEERLYSEINQADVVVFPYREISLSGALLLALYFNKKIIPSDIPSFRETLDGFKTEWFFKSGNANALSKLMIDHLDGERFCEEWKMISLLKHQYSWETAANKTLELYGY